MDIKIIRSPRRHKSVSAKMEGDIFIVQAPAHLGDHELQPIIERLYQRYQQKHTKSALDNQILEDRAQELNHHYFNGQLTWRSISWVTNQQSRWGSCTPATATIRLSHRLHTMPTFVLDYVLIHELTHLLEPNHSQHFWQLVNRYPKTERARGYLMAVGLEELA